MPLRHHRWDVRDSGGRRSPAAKFGPDIGVLAKVDARLAVVEAGADRLHDQSRTLQAGLGRFERVCPVRPCGDHAFEQLGAAFEGRGHLLRQFNSSAIAASYGGSYCARCQQGTCLDRCNRTGSKIVSSYLRLALQCWTGICMCFGYNRLLDCRNSALAATHQEKSEQGDSPNPQEGEKKGSTRNIFDCGGCRRQFGSVCGDFRVFSSGECCRRISDFASCYGRGRGNHVGGIYRSRKAFRR